MSEENYDGWNFEKMRKYTGELETNLCDCREQLKTLVSKVPSIYLTNTLKDINTETPKWIYEQNPDTGVLYRRKFGDYDSREEVDEAGNPIIMYEQLNLFDNQTRK